MAKGTTTMGAGIRAASYRLAFALLFAASGALAQGDDPGFPGGYVSGTGWARFSIPRSDRFG